MTTTLQKIIDGYFDCWNTTDAAQRAAAVASTWSEDATSSDPLHEVTGHGELDAMIAQTQQTYPGHVFQQVGATDTHHDLVRWQWEMLDSSGTRVLDGIDVAVLAEDGRLSKLAGFFGAAVPALAS